VSSLDFGQRFETKDKPIAAQMALAQDVTGFPQRVALSLGSSISPRILATVIAFVTVAAVARCRRCIVDAGNDCFGRRLTGVVVVPAASGRDPVARVAAHVRHVITRHDPCEMATDYLGEFSAVRRTRRVCHRSTSRM
jgi:hypothetical protein